MLFILIVVIFSQLYVYQNIVLYSETYIIIYMYIYKITYKFLFLKPAKFKKHTKIKQ